MVSLQQTQAGLLSSAGLQILPSLCHLPGLASSAKLMFNVLLIVKAP